MQAGVTIRTSAPLTAGLGYLSSHEGGKAVKCAGESTSLCQAAAKAAAVFDKSAPASLAGDHQYFDAAFAESTASLSTTRYAWSSPCYTSAMYLRAAE